MSDDFYVVHEHASRQVGGVGARQELEAAGWTLVSQHTERSETQGTTYTMVFTRNGDA